MSSGPVFIAVVSDGAGSAEHSSIGSKIVCREFLNFARSFLGSGRQPIDLVETDVLDCLDAIRDHIEVQASAFASHPRAFAATLVGCIVHSNSSAFIHVGDGAAVYRIENESDWKVASWPSQGEYASTTHFVTDYPEPRFSLEIVENLVDTVALFTDGLERLALDFAKREAFPNFFKGMFSSLSNKNSGHDRKLSAQLKDFLDSPSVCERTDDDKTLILAQRIIPQCRPR